MKPSLGRIVIVRTAQEYNGAREHPAVITRVFSDRDTMGEVGGFNRVNLTVMPDCHSPFSATSVPLFETEKESHGASETIVAWWPPKV